MKSFFTTGLLITLLVATASSIPLDDREDLLQNQSLMERVINLLAEDKAEVEVN